MLFAFALAFVNFSAELNLIKAILISLVAISTLSTFIYSNYIVFGRKLGLLIDAVAVVLWSQFMDLGVMGVWVLVASIRQYLVGAFILAAIALPQYRKAVIKSRLAELDIMINTAKKNIELYLSANDFPAANKTVYFTGTKSIAEIEPPGNCSVAETGCTTDLVSFQAQCDNQGCQIHFQAKGNWLGGPLSSNLYLYKSDMIWYEMGSERSPSSVLKIYCPYLKERNILGHRSTVRACSSVGVTLEEY